MKKRKKLSIAFLWHMHQPFYKDTLSGKYLLPWVRLHAVKDYYPMAAIAEDFEDLRMSFNMVPSLVEQIIDYVENGATDTWLDLTVKKASHLTTDEKIRALNDLFSVNAERFIKPHPRYSELLAKRGDRPVTKDSFRLISKNFTAEDYLDLQVLFNMAWFHSISVDDDINLKDLIDRQRSYSEEDKEYVVMKEKEIMAQVLPLYRRLRDDGRIDITTTPFYHPIMPLLCDTSIAKVSSPAMRLPKKRFMHPEDVSWHVEEAVRYHAEQFGVRPDGMWPSEGSVSDETLSILASKGISWVATDEDILFKSLSLCGKRPKGRGRDLFDRRLIYQPYVFRKGSKRISMVFRDKNLSDMISFSYNQWDPADAANDLLGHFGRIAENLRRDTDRGIVTIVMDGENAWDYYRDNGRKFFETLYSGIDAGADVGSSTVSGYLEDEKPKKALSSISPGSWINHNFEIWIGQEQDNLSWGYLDRVRRDLVKFTTSSDGKRSGASDAANRAWREFYISEGSDWNWWYMGKVGRGGNVQFDDLYRTHLKNIYKLLKRPVPDFLKISIV